jgi:hypothetical protein
MRNATEQSRLAVAALALACWACGSDDSSDTEQSCTADTGPGEPTNNAEASPVTLPPMTDSDPAMYPQIAGVIYGSADVDWYTYTGSDVALAIVDPYVAFPPDLRVCSYFECVAGTTSVTCPNGTTSDRSGAGKSGCCPGPGYLSYTAIDVYCGTVDTDENMRVFIRVDGPGLSASACVPYTVDYHY